MIKRKAIALGDFDGMHLAHKVVVTGAENATIYCVNNKFSLLQKSIFEKRYPNAVFAVFDDIKNMKVAELREVFTGMDVVYVYHNRPRL